MSTDIKYNGNSIGSIQAGESSTIMCAGTRMRGDIVISAAGEVDVVYNGSTIATLKDGQVAVLKCRGKIMTRDISVVAHQVLITIAPPSQIFMHTDTIVRWYTVPEASGYILYYADSSGNVNTLALDASTRWIDLTPYCTTPGDWTLWVRATRVVDGAVYISEPSEVITYTVAVPPIEAPSSVTIRNDTLTWYYVQDADVYIIYLEDKDGNITTIEHENSTSRLIRLKNYCAEGTWTIWVCSKKTVSGIEYISDPSEKLTYTVSASDGMTPAILGKAILGRTILGVTVTSSKLEAPTIYLSTAEGDIEPSKLPAPVIYLQKGDMPVVPTKLATPVIRMETVNDDTVTIAPPSTVMLQESYVRWHAVSGANGYIVYYSDSAGNVYSAETSDSIRYLDLSLYCQTPGDWTIWVCSTKTVDGVQVVSEASEKLTYVREKSKLTTPVIRLHTVDDSEEEQPVDYSMQVGDEMEVVYTGSGNPVVESPDFLSWYDDGGVLIFIAESAGNGILRIYQNGDLLYCYNITVTEECKHTNVDLDRVEPTCVSDGYEKTTCNDCDYSNTVVLPATDHNWCEPYYSDDFSTGYGCQCEYCGELWSLELPVSKLDAPVIHLETTCDHVWGGPYEDDGSETGWVIQCEKCGVCVDTEAPEDGGDDNPDDGDFYPTLDTPVIRLETVEDEIITIDPPSTVAIINTTVLKWFGVADADGYIVYYSDADGNIETVETDLATRALDLTLYCTTPGDWTLWVRSKRIVDGVEYVSEPSEKVVYTVPMPNDGETVVVFEGDLTATENIILGTSYGNHIIIEDELLSADVKHYTLSVDGVDTKLDPGTNYVWAAYNEDTASVYLLQQTVGQTNIEGDGSFVAGETYAIRITYNTNDCVPFLFEPYIKLAEVEDVVPKLNTPKVWLQVPAPTNLRFEDGVLYWDAVDGAERYTVQIVGVLTTNTTGCNYDVSQHIGDAGTYEIRVRSFTEETFTYNPPDGYEYASISQYFEGVPAPDAPVLTVTEDDTTYYISWDAVDGAAYYKVHMFPSFSTGVYWNEDEPQTQKLSKSSTAGTYEYVVFAFNKFDKASVGSNRIVITIE